MIRKISLLFWCSALALSAYVLLDYWAFRNSHPVQKLDRLWAEDIKLLETSNKLPKGWFKLKNIELYGGTDEAKAWLKRLNVPIKTTKDGTHSLEILLLVFDEDGKKGAAIQYDMVDIKTKNLVWELGRTFILSGEP
jgi:hypothetical protein